MSADLTVFLGTILAVLIVVGMLIVWALVSIAEAKRKDLEREALIKDIADNV